VVATASGEGIPTRYTLFPHAGSWCLGLKWCIFLYRRSLTVLTAIGTCYACTKHSTLAMGVVRTPNAVAVHLKGHYSCVQVYSITFIIPSGVINRR